jgi:hexosaminidase
VSRYGSAGGKTGILTLTGCIRSLADCGWGTVRARVPAEDRILFTRIGIMGSKASPLPRSRFPLWSSALFAAWAVSACAAASGVEARATAAPQPPPHHLIPVPVAVQFVPGESFTVDSATVIVVQPGDAEAARIGRYLAALIGTTPAWTPRVVADAASPAPGSIALVTDVGATRLGEEGYELTVSAEHARIVARTPAGLFYGVQTFRQLLPAAVEYAAALPRPMQAPAVTVTDYPRFEWRGAMLDVSRHFLQVEDVKRYIDLMALYKLNRLHLHLSDDQGWRIEIRSWPNLALYGGSTQVGGGPGGYYTQEQYTELVSYAQDRFITVVPEIDIPGHTNAALASYPELNCDGVAPPLYTGITVGFSALCVEKEITYRFVDDVVREIAALTPGAFFHIGGDEVETIEHEEYKRFIERAQEIVNSHGKRMIGWGEIAPARLHPTSVVQHWRPDSSAVAVARGASVIISPATHIYLDMKYDATTVLGLNWAGYTEVNEAYDWDPATLIEGVPERAILGVEAPLWSETLVDIRDFEYMAFPRLAGVAEIGWSPASHRDWNEYRVRLGAQAPRWAALGINFYRSPGVSWQD